MIEVYAFATPNSVKAPIALEELGVPYHLNKVNIRAGEQKTPAFTALNPNAKVPVIVDPDGPGGQPITIVEIRGDPDLFGGKVRQADPRRP